MHPEFRSVLLAEFYEKKQGNSEIVMELEEFLFSPESQQQKNKKNKPVLFQNSINTSKHLTMLPH